METSLVEIEQSQLQTDLEEQPVVCEMKPGQVQKAKRHGLTWVAGSFLLCPCHLPFTLGLFATLFGGTAVGTTLQQYPLLAGGVITVVWGAGTWRGLRYLRQARNCTTCNAK